jgi:beta-lactamase class A
MNKTTRYFCWAFALIFLWAARAIAGPLPLPPSAVDPTWRPLYERYDSKLQADLEAALQKNAFWQSLIKKKKMAVGVVDLSDPKSPRFARVNGRTMMYAASLPKIAVLLAAYVSFEDGSLKETPEIRQDLIAMIRKSDNAAATRMIDRVGFKKIQAVVMDPRYQFYDTEKGGGLWVGKRYAKKGNRNPDPMKGLSHGANVTQVCRFYYQLANGRIINPKRSGEMLEILSNPRIEHKFVNILRKLVPRTRIYRKSGTWRNWHSDSVLVWGPVWRRYILVSILESEQGEQILKDIVPVIEGILHPVEDFMADPTLPEAGAVPK